MFGWLKSMFGTGNNSPTVTVTPAPEAKVVKKAVTKKKAPSKKKAPAKKSVTKKKVAKLEDVKVVSDQPVDAIPEIPMEGLVVGTKKRGRPKKNP